MRAPGLYDAALLARTKDSVGPGTLDAPCRRVRLENRVCGDEVELDARLPAERIEALAHRVRGCAVVRGSASLLAETVPGRAAADASDRIAALERWLAGKGDLPSDLAALAPMRLYPARSLCVLLPWQALATA